MKYILLVIPTFLITTLLISTAFMSVSFAGNAELIKLDSDYTSEHVDSKTIYLDSVQRKKFEIKVNYKGQVVNQYGRAIDTRNLPNGVAMFVYSKEGKIYLSTKRSITLFTHSSLVAGEDVIVAGMMSVRRGRVKFMTDVSPRYYTRSEGNLKAAKYRLKVMGVDTQRTRLFFHFNL